MWGDLATGGVVLGFVALTAKWQYSRISKVETRQKKALYQHDGQTNYVPRSEYKEDQIELGNKMDEIKDLIIDMDKKREKAKDNYHKDQQEIRDRLKAIEVKLP